MICVEKQLKFQVMDCTMKQCQIYSTRLLIYVQFLLYLLYIKYKKNPTLEIKLSAHGHL